MSPDEALAEIELQLVFIASGPPGDMPAARRIGELLAAAGCDSGTAMDVICAMLTSCEPLPSVEHMAAICAEVQRGSDVPPPESKPTSKTARAASIILDALADGPLPVNALKTLADEAGICWGLFERAKGILQIKSHKTGLQDGWVWQLEG